MSKKENKIWDAGFSCRRPTFCAFKRDRRHRPRSHQCWSTFSSLMGGCIKGFSCLSRCSGVFPRRGSDFQATDLVDKSILFALRYVLGKVREWPNTAPSFSASQSGVFSKRSVRFPRSASPFLVDEACRFKFIVLDKPPGLLKIAQKVGWMCRDKGIV